MDVLSCQYTSISTILLKLLCSVPLYRWPYKGFLGDSVIKNLSAHAGDIGSVSGSGRTPEGGNGNPFQYSCLENPMDRGVWQATVHSVAKELDTTFSDWAQNTAFLCIAEKNYVINTLLGVSWFSPIFWWGHKGKQRRPNNNTLVIKQSQGCLVPSRGGIDNILSYVLWAILQILKSGGEVNYLMIRL